MTCGTDDRRTETLARLTAIAADLSGCTTEELADSAGFVQSGFDSLFMTQLANTYQQAFGIRLTFRHLIDECPSLGVLSDYIVARLPRPDVRPAKQMQVATASTALEPASSGTPLENSLLESVIRRQIELMDLQLAQLRRMRVTSIPTPAAGAPAAAMAVSGAGKLNSTQKHHLERLAARLQAHTRSSVPKAARVLPTPSNAVTAAASFDAISAWRDLDFPIALARSVGGHLWDLDNNRYIDLSLGGGTNLLGHHPDVVTNAIRRCVGGLETRPLAALVKEATQALRNLTRFEHVTWMRSATLAMQAALQVARTKTGRRQVIHLAGTGNSPEGQAAGTDHEGAASRSADDLHMVFGSGEAIAEIRRNPEGIAAVVVDAMQDGLSDDDARVFLHLLRELTREQGILLVFDERTSGFRLHPSGAQGYFGVQADLAAYGGLLGTIQPLGALAGAMPLADAMDEPVLPAGGFRPGTIGGSTEDDVGSGLVLSMCCAQATLDHLSTHGPVLQERLGELAAQLCDALNLLFKRQGAPLQALRRGSQVRLGLGDTPLAGLLTWHLRVRGVYVTPTSPLYVCTAHDDNDMATVVAAFEDSIHDMQHDGVMPRAASAGPSAWRRVVPTTSSQRELFFASQLGDLASCAYNESDAIRITGPLDVPLLLEAVAETLASHEALRMRFDAYGDTQVVSPDASFRVHQTDLSHLDRARAETQLAAVVVQESLTPFDLENGPLARVHLLKMPGSSHVLLMYFHHIAFDGYSGHLVMEEIFGRYNARRQGAEPKPPQAVPYSVFVYRSQARADQEITTRSLTYWQSLFAVDPPRPLELPTDRVRGPVRRPAAGTVHREFGPEVLQAVKALAKAQGTTLFAVLLAGFEALLARLGNQEDVVVAIPAAGQAHLGLETVGYCVTALPIRSRPARGKAFAQHALETQRAVLDALDHQDVNLGAIIRSLRLPGSRARLPLAEVMFNFSSFLSKLKIDGCTVVAHENCRRAMFYDMFLHAVESDGRLIMDWDYRSDLFDAATIDHWLDGYRDLMLAAAQAPAILIGDLPKAEPADEAAA